MRPTTQTCYDNKGKKFKYFRIYKDCPMRVPIRKPGKYSQRTTDPIMTADKLIALIKQLEKLKKRIRPGLIEEVKRLALMGDFSENAAYQIAKGRLRGLNQAIWEISEQIKKAAVIKPDQNCDFVRIGHWISLECQGKLSAYHLLGSAETDPLTGVISRSSPLGAALLGRRVGEIIKVQLPKGEKTYRITSIANSK
ncbi:hypothetical protein COX69_00480 [Candidatus Falkowbacteria bacterium CG_4_10_14_0_2_um_filter_48_10]|nr:MAG: hypothetical protein COX69_00480 [Candidatus Falkowbacteria bacterium CG_4_10_14_0_2_um_filter_48_10]